MRGYDVGQLLRLAAVIALAVTVVLLLWVNDAELRDVLALGFAGLGLWAGAELADERA